MSNTTTSRRAVRSLSELSPAGRTFAKEFAEIQKLAPSIVEGVERALKCDPDFVLFFESGVRVMANLRCAPEESAFGDIPTGILEYRIQMPTGEELVLQQELKIQLSYSGTPIFWVGELRLTSLKAASLVMETAVKYMLV
ncbi:MAG: hypothetical protein Q7S83_02190 [bacterium]|nr:hypothetical protein [bacterium]